MTLATADGVAWLDITGAYGTHADKPAEGQNIFEHLKESPQGVEDKDGVEHFNDRVTTPFGWLGNLKGRLEVGDDGQPVQVITQADGVVLVSKKPVEEWGEAQVGATVETNPFGFRILTIQARNGMVRYLLHDDEVRWRDMPDQDTGQQIGKLITSQWTPEGPLLPRLKHETTVKVVRRAK